MTGQQIGLVGCASQKLSRPAPARDLYVSPLFRKASAYAEQTCDRWFVLSAQHGLLNPDQVIEPYNLKLGTKYAPPIWNWAARVREQLAHELEGTADPHLVMLAGSQYMTVVQLDCPWAWSEPMEGLGIGERLAWLNAHLS